MIFILTLLILIFTVVEIIALMGILWLLINRKKLVKVTENINNGMSKQFAINSAFGRDLSKLKLFYLEIFIIRKYGDID